MSALGPKSPASSVTEMTEYVLPQHATVFGTVFGGQIMAWVDICAAICAQRHAGRPCVTAFVDDLLFRSPVHVGQVVRLRGQVVATFRTSMEIEVTVDGEDTVTGAVWPTVECFVTMVAMSDDRRPTPVPPPLARVGRSPQSSSERSPAPPATPLEEAAARLNRLAWCRVLPSREARMSALPHFHAETSARVDDVISCEHADRCGGCPLIGLPYAEQLEKKRGRVSEAMARYPSLRLALIEPVAPATRIISYRTRAKLMVARGARVGLFAKGGGHEVVDVPGCRVLAPTLARVASHLRARIAASERTGGALEPFDEAGGGSLRAIDLREVMSDDSQRVLVTFVVERARVADLGLLRQEATNLTEALPEVLGVAANFHVGETPQVLGGETLVLTGATSAPDRIGPSIHFATFGSFVQVHRDQASRVHALLVDALGLLRREARPPRVLDLYGGSGAISLGLAAAGASVHLVEAFGPAVAQANAGANAQGLDVQAERADAAAALRAISDSGQRFDAVVLNPPRRGASPATREGIARLEPQIVAYVSCDPETLARDLEHLTRLGYGVVSQQPIDMIPLTEEIETVAILRRAAVPPPRVLYENADIFIVEKGPHEPTTPQGEYASSLLARARLLSGGESCVPVHRLDVGTSGLVMFARQPERVAKWARALSAPSTRKIYIAAVRGVTPGKGAISRDLHEDGKLHRARTRYKRLAIASGQSILRVTPDQGRTHQIRRHLASIGHAVLGDDRYGHAPTNRYFSEKHALDRAFLHCGHLEIDHPDTGARLIIEAPLAGDLRAVLERISGPGTLRFLDLKNAFGTSGAPPNPSPPGER